MNFYPDISKCSPWTNGRAPETRQDLRTSLTVMGGRGRPNNSNFESRTSSAPISIVRVGQGFCFAMTIKTLRKSLSEVALTVIK